jgi:hypothetical protein
MKIIMTMTSTMILLGAVSVGSFGEVAAIPATQKRPGASQQAIKSPSPDEWIVSEEDMWIPVIDKLGQDLQSARHHFVSGDKKSAEKDILAGAAFLRDELPKIPQDRDKGQLLEAAGNLEDLAGKIKLGQATSVKDLDPVFLKAYDADTAQRWLLSDTVEWFPIVEAPQQHFLAARAALKRKDVKGAAAHIRKAAAFIKLEAGRTTAEGKGALVASSTELMELASSIEKGTVTDASKLSDAFAKAQDAMAKSHYLKAAEGWAKRDYANVSAELKAAAKHVENAATWTH